MSFYLHSGSLPDGGSWRRWDSSSSSFPELATESKQHLLFLQKTYLCIKYSDSNKYLVTFRQNNCSNVWGQQNQFF